MPASVVWKPTDTCKTASYIIPHLIRREFLFNILFPILLGGSFWFDGGAHFAVFLLYKSLFALAMFPTAAKTIRTNKVEEENLK